MEQSWNVSEWKCACYDGHLGEQCFYFLRKDSVPWVGTLEWTTHATEAVFSLRLETFHLSCPWETEI